MNDLGYQPFDRNYKSPNMIVRTLVDVISMGGNLLIDIGPKADGSIPAEQVKILENLGRWTKKIQMQYIQPVRVYLLQNYRGKKSFFVC